MGRDQNPNHEEEEDGSDLRSMRDRLKGLEPLVELTEKGYVNFLKKLRTASPRLYYLSDVALRDHLIAMHMTKDPVIPPILKI